MFKEILKNTLLGSAVKELITPDGYEDLPAYPIMIDPSRYGNPDSGDWGFAYSNGDYTYFKYTSFTSAVRAYEQCPPVSAIINRKAQAFTNGKTWVMNSKEKEAQGAIANKMRALMKKPNPIQSWKQFEAQMYIYTQAFGFNIILPIKPFGFTENIDASSLWNIPANWIDIRATEEVFTRNGGVTLQEIVVNFNNQRIVLSLKDLIIIKDITPSFKTITFPNSRLLSLEAPISNIIGAYDSRRTLINNRGAIGILTHDPGKGQFMAAGMDPETKKDLHRDFKKSFGLRSHQLQVIVTAASLKWQSMGYSARELMLIEEVQEDTVAICANLNFPPFILGIAQTTYNNMTEAEKDLYNNSIIPDACNIYEQLSDAFNLEAYNLHLDKDYAHLPVLQKDAASQATARKALDDALKLEFDNGLITINDWLIELGKDPLPPDLGDVRSTDLKNTNAPLVTIIGVGGVQGLIEVVANPTMSDEAKQATLEVVFGLAPADAARMCASNTNTDEGQVQENTGQQAA